MKRMLVSLCICILLSALPLACSRAEEASAAEMPVSDGAGASVTATDDILRAQLRLRDLGYYVCPVDGADNAAYQSALAAFCAESGYLYNGRIPTPLFSASAAVAPFNAQNTIFVRTFGTPLVTGDAVTWEELLPMLTEGAEYEITACYSGIACKLRFLGGDNHARMTPALDWDAATLTSIFGEHFQCQKQPVVLTVGETRAAASLAPLLPANGSEDILPIYELYCEGATSGINGVMDVDHALLIRIAAGE